MKYFAGIGIIALVMAATTSCRSTKTIQTVLAKKDTTQMIPVVDYKADSMLFIKNVWDTIRKNNIDFKTFDAKVKVDFERSDGRKVDFNAFIRLKKDSILWMSVNWPLGEAM